MNFQTLSGNSLAKLMLKKAKNPYGEPLVMLASRNAIKSTLPFTLEFPYVVDLEFYLRIASNFKTISDSSRVGSFRLNRYSASSLLKNSQLNDFLLFANKRCGINELKPFHRFFFIFKLRLNTVVRQAAFKILQKF